MEYILYGGVTVVAGAVFTFGFKFIRKRRKIGTKDDTMSKIGEFYASQNNDLNY